MVHKATKVTIIAEELLEEQITAKIAAAGATGYTILEGSGRGQHSTHPKNRPSVVSGFSIIKIEFVMLDRERALALADDIADTDFKSQSGIVYISEVEVLRPSRF